MTPPPRPKFWQTVPLDQMTREEWELLCDGCGKCCLNKIEYEDTGEVDYTRIACRLLDGATCQCRHYETRLDFVPDCITLTPEKLDEVAYWLPRTCAYRRLHEGRSLPRWHHLLTGDRETVHRVGASVKGWTLPETDVPEDDWDDYVIKEKP